jgi:hypothetical protein
MKLGGPQAGSRGYGGEKIIATIGFRTPDNPARDESRDYAIPTTYKREGLHRILILAVPALNPVADRVF